MVSTFNLFLFYIFLTNSFVHSQLWSEYRQSFFAFVFVTRNINNYFLTISHRWGVHRVKIFNVESQKWLYICLYVHQKLPIVLTINQNSNHSQTLPNYNLILFFRPFTLSGSTLPPKYYINVFFSKTNPNLRCTIFRIVSNSEVYVKKQFTGNSLTIWNSTITHNDQTCAIWCSDTNHRHSK